jgi:dipeptide transport system ATP-binding protein
MPLLEIRNLTVTFAMRHGAFTAVDRIDVTLDRNEVLAIVGESGSGKSVAMLAVMGLLPPTATVEADRMAFDGADLLTMSRAERRRLAGKDMAMIFQEPMSIARLARAASSNSWPRSAFPIRRAARTLSPISFRAA